jgi:Zn-dependent protease with chaperone function
VTTARLTDLVFWPLLTLAALAQAAGLVLIGAEFLVLDPAQTAAFNLAAYVVLATTSLTGHAVAARTALRAAAAGHRLSAIARCRARRPPAQLLAAEVPLGLAGRVDYVTAAEAFALTHGLLRPRILLSTAALAILDPAELAAVLGHERAHLRRRDPLRLLAARLLADDGCYLPALRWISHRLALHCELAADRAALDHSSRAALAGALLKLAPAPAGSLAASANPPGTLDARIAQLEHRRPHRPRLRAAAALATLGNAAVLSAAVACPPPSHRPAASRPGQAVTRSGPKARPAISTAATWSTICPASSG